MTTGQPVVFNPRANLAWTTSVALIALKRLEKGQSIKTHEFKAILSLRQVLQSLTVYIAHGPEGLFARATDRPSDGDKVDLSALLSAGCSANDLNPSALESTERDLGAVVEQLGSDGGSLSLRSSSQPLIPTASRAFLNDLLVQLS